MALASWVLIMSKDGCSTASLGNMILGLTTLNVKTFFLLLNLNGYKSATIIPMGGLVSLLPVNKDVFSCPASSQRASHSLCRGCVGCPLPHAGLHICLCWASWEAHLSGFLGALWMVAMNPSIATAPHNLVRPTNLLSMHAVSVLHW